MYNNMHEDIDVNIDDDMHIRGGIVLNNAQSMLKNAHDEIKHLYSGEVFIMRDLFKGYEWNRIPIGERLLLGTLFLNDVNAGSVKVVAVEKTTSGQQKYRVL